MPNEELRLACLVESLTTQVKKLEAQKALYVEANLRLQSACDCFEKASAIACADADKAESEASALREKLSQAREVLQCALPHCSNTSVEQDILEALK